VERHLHLDGVDHNGGPCEAAGESKAVTRPPGFPSTSPARARRSSRRPRGLTALWAFAPRQGSAGYPVQAGGDVRLQGLADHRALLDVSQIAAFDDAVEPVRGADLLG
jgi:hypothetical protein